MARQAKRLRPDKAAGGRERVAWNVPRLIGITVVMVGLAVLLILQAVSGALSKKAPEIAVTMPFPNGFSQERLAYQEFTANLTDPNETGPAAEASSDAALSAYRVNGLTSRALAILAMSEDDLGERSNLLQASLRLNRRDPVLQSLVFQDALAANDYSGGVEALDRLLRVNPEFTRDLFPVLADALRNEATVQSFAAMLDGSSPWHQRFLRYSLNNSDLLTNLASLRAEIDLNDERFDRGLIDELAKIGEIEVARSVLDLTAAETSLVDGVGTLSWTDRFAPFDWRLYDDKGIRAQLNDTSDGLDIYVRAGRGGVLAERLIKAPDRAFSIEVKHRIAPIEQVRDLRLELECVANQQIVLDERFTAQTTRFDVPNLGPECGDLMLRFEGRAWSGRSALAGEITSVEIK